MRLDTNFFVLPFLSCLAAASRVEATYSLGDFMVELLMCGTHLHCGWLLR